MARTPASDGRDGVGKSGSPAPRSITSSPAALRRFASCEMAIVAEVSRWCRLGERPDPGVMGGRIARTGKGTQPEPRLRCLSLHHALPSLPTDRPLTTEDRVTEADAKAALERGRPVVLVRPPAVEQARDLWELLGPLSPGHGPGVGPRVLVVCADDASAAEWVAVAPDDRSIHAVTGLGRLPRPLRRRPAVSPFHRPAGCPRRVGRDDAVRLERRPHHTTRGTPGCGALHRAPEPRRGRRARPTGGRRARLLHRRDPTALPPLDRDPHAPGRRFRG